MDRLQRLQEVIERGSTGQAALARELVGTELSDDVDLLYDAYLHDPYLTRY
jgi:hypothetical protein